MIKARNHRSSSPPQSLTAREHDVLSEIAQGRSNMAIGEALGISQSSVETYINIAFTKANLDPDETAVNRRVMAALTFLRDPTAGPAQSSGATPPTDD